MLKTARQLCVGSALVALCGCDHFLATSPQSFVGSTNFYQTPDQIDRAVIGAYAYLQQLYGAGGTSPMWILGEMRSDNTTYQYNGGQRGNLLAENVDDFLVTPDNIVGQNLWTQAYAMIQQTNVVLGRIDAVTYTAPAEKARAAAEMKFLRAFAYFHLVRTFGDVPLRLTEVATYADAFTKSRTPTAEVYAQIIKDLTEAIPALPVRGSLPAAQAGRATKGAASMLLADVYMTQTRFADAVPVLQSVMGMGYSLVTPYERVFDPVAKNGPESIFEVQFAEAVVDRSSAFLFRFVPFNSARDLTFVSTDNVTGSGGWNIPTHDMIRAYEPGDLRKDASIGWYVKAGNNTFTDVAINDSIPYIKKYYHPYTTAGRTNDDFPVYRYAEAKLLLAEALNETGQTGAALPHINDVRTRAGLPTLAGLSQAEVRDTVAHEQRVELAFENKRWFQLVRLGKAVAVMTAHGADLKSYTTRRSAATYNVTQNSLLMPIPIRELTLNPFTQNPGY
ncbi:MAG: RagB/SusD family nutrient uptake outer membrane protein [Gemmatimonadaceae bacterium]